MEQPTLDYPLKPDHYFSVRVQSRRSHSAGEAVSSIRQALGLSPQPHVFDQQLRAAVEWWQAGVDLPITGVVTEVDWVVLFQPK